MFLRIIGTVLIKVQIIKSLAYPACLYVTIIVKGICLSVNLLHSPGIIGSVCILIPFAIFVLMPPGSQIRSTGNMRYTCQRHPDGLCFVCGYFFFCSCCFCLSLIFRIISICCHLHGFSCILTADLICNGQNHALYDKYYYQHHSQYITAKLHHFAASKLLLLFAHPFLQNSFIHCFPPAIISICPCLSCLSYCIFYRNTIALPVHFPYIYKTFLKSSSFLKFTCQQSVSCCPFSGSIQTADIVLPLSEDL